MKSSARVMILLVGIVQLALGTLSWTLTPKGPRGGAIFVAGPLGLVLIGVGIFGYRRRDSPDDPAFQPEGWPSAEERKVLLKTERVGLTGQPVRFLLDPIKGIAYFERCHYPDRFLSVAQTYFACPVGDLLAARRDQGSTRFGRNQGACLNILTKTGQAFCIGDDVEAIHHELASLGVPPLGGPELKSEWTVSVAMLYGLAGGVASIPWLSAAMSSPAFYGTMGLGVVTGVGLLLLVVAAGHRLFGLRLLVPMVWILVLGPVGAILGNLLHRVPEPEFLRILLGPSASTAFTLIGAALGVAGGAALGGTIQRGREQGVEEIVARRKARGSRKKPRPLD